MKLAKLYKILALGLLLATGLGARAAGDEDKRKVKILSLNCYCFPAATRDALYWLTKTLDNIGLGPGKKDLAGGVKTPIPERIQAIANFVLSKDPDIVCFQELWKGAKSGNKRRMIDLLQGRYKYYFYNLKYQDIPRMDEMDDGLLIMSKFPPLESSAGDEGKAVKRIIYNDFSGDEKMAHKGAIIFEFQHNYETMVLATTHLQSGTDHDDVEIKSRQMRQLGGAMMDLVNKTTSPLEQKDLQWVVVGDVNEPVTYKAGEGRIYDRTAVLMHAFNGAIEKDTNNRVYGKVTLGCQGRLKELQGLYRARDVIAQDELKDAAVGRFPFDGGQGGNWTYWPVSTDGPGGVQVLDHAFIAEDRSRLEDYRVFRKEILNDKGDGKTPCMDEAKAISDHAAILFTVVPTRPTQNLHPYLPY